MMDGSVTKGGKMAEEPKKEDNDYEVVNPTPQGMVDMLLEIYESNPKPEKRAYARQQLINAMRIAYARWYPKDPAYRLPPKTYPETHQQGAISIENIPPEISSFMLGNGGGMMFKGDFGIQIAEDGRVWVCINGIAFLRFTPTLKGGDKDEKPKAGNRRRKV